MVETMKQHLEAPSRIALPSKQWNSNLPTLSYTSGKLSETPAVGSKFLSSLRLSVPFYSISLLVRSCLANKADLPQIRRCKM